MRKRRHGGGKRRAGGEHAALAAQALQPAAGSSGQPRSHERCAIPPGSAAHRPPSFTPATGARRLRARRSLLRAQRGSGIQAAHTGFRFANPKRSQHVPNKSRRGREPVAAPPGTSPLGPRHSLCPCWQGPSSPAGTRVWFEPHGQHGDPAAARSLCCSAQGALPKINRPSLTTIALPLDFGTENCFTACECCSSE